MKLYGKTKLPATEPAPPGRWRTAPSGGSERQRAWGLHFITLVAAFAVLPAAAQVQRNFPAAALRGELAVVVPPEAQLNGNPARLAPGARIRDQNNMLQVSGVLAGRKQVVNYTRDINGQLLDIWVLTPTEVGRQPWPTTEAQAKSWSFDPIGQTWSKP